MTKQQALYPVELFLFRHGEGRHNLDPHTMAGQSNHMELTKQGARQALQLGRVLERAGIFPTKAFASDAKRAIDTGRGCLRAMGLSSMEIHTRTALRELGHGPWEGRPRVEAYTPEVLAQIPLLGKDFKLEGGESMNDVITRGRLWLKEEAPDPEPTQERYFVFTHGIFIKCLVGNLLGWDRAQTYYANVENTWVAQLRGSGDEWEVVRAFVDATEI